MRSNAERGLILLLRISIGWVFLYAASHQVFNPAFSVAGFLGTATTFHDFMAFFTRPALEPVVSFLVAYGHLLIGLSLIFGLCTRISSFFGIFLMAMYWMAHVNFPILDGVYFLVDVHVISALVLALMIVVHAGHVWGLDGLVARRRVVAATPALAWATAG